MLGCVVAWASIGVAAALQNAFLIYIVIGIDKEKATVQTQQMKSLGIIRQGWRRGRAVWGNGKKAGCATRLVSAI